MPLTAANLRSLLKANLHNDQTFTDPGDLNTYLTLGQQRIVQDSPATLGMKQGTITTDTVNREYSLASDFYQMAAAPWLQTQNWDLDFYNVPDFIEIVERRATIPSGPPRNYTILGYDDVTNNVWRIRFDYIPDAVYSIKYFYYWMPTDVSGTATPAVSAIGFGTLLLDAASMIACQRNDPEGFALYSGNYGKGIEKYMNFMAAGPHYTPIQGPQSGSMGSTLRLPPQYPSS